MSAGTILRIVVTAALVVGATVTVASPAGAETVDVVFNCDTATVTATAVPGDTINFTVGEGCDTHAAYADGHLNGIGGAESEGMGGFELLRFERNVGATDVYTVYDWVPACVAYGVGPVQRDESVPRQRLELTIRPADGSETPNPRGCGRYVKQGPLSQICPKLLPVDAAQGHLNVKPVKSPRWTGTPRVGRPLSKVISYGKWSLASPVTWYQVTWYVQEADGNYRQVAVPGGVGADGGSPFGFGKRTDTYKPPAKYRGQLIVAQVDAFSKRNTRRGMGCTPPTRIR